MAKRARVDPYADYGAIGLGAAGQAEDSAQAGSDFLSPSDADEPKEVQVYSDSDSSCSSQSDDEILNREDSRPF